MDEYPGHDATSVDACWQRLIEAGLPLGAARPRGAPCEPRSLAAAVRRIMASGAPVAALEVEALAAFLRAWRQHWPRSFAEALGPEGGAWEEELTRRVSDPGRLVRLKRIAVAHLARQL